jgi:hypothetical protein
MAKDQPLDDSSTSMTAKLYLMCVALLAVLVFL